MNSLFSYSIYSFLPLEVEVYGGPKWQNELIKYAIK